MTATPTTGTRTPVPHRASTTVIALGIPAVMVTAVVIVALAWRQELPDPIATHWGPSGEADRFGPFGPHVTAHAVIVMLFAAGLWAIGFFWGREAMTRRFVAGAAAWFAGVLSGVLLGNLSIQRGLTDATEVGTADGPLLFAFAVGTVAAVLAAWAVPGDRRRPTHDPLPEGAATLDLGADEQATWVQEVGQSGLVVVLGGIVTFAVVMALVTQQWAMIAAITTALGLLLAVMLRWTVTVDHNGLTARSLLRRPGVQVPLDEVVVAEEVQVDPLREFGGWGLRTGRGGRTGVVVRKGSSLQVRRTGGRVLVVTVDDAATGAALLNTLAARARQG